MHDYEPHIGASRQYMRDIILGVNDGLVSTFLLVSGVVGGGMTSAQVLLTGVAGAIAGMISMGTGEYLATKSQDEVFAAEMELDPIDAAVEAVVVAHVGPDSWQARATAARLAAAGG